MTPYLKFYKAKLACPSEPNLSREAFQDFIDFCPKPNRLKGSFDEEYEIWRNNLTEFHQQQLKLYNAKGLAIKKVAIFSDEDIARTEALDDFLCWVT